MTLPEAVLQMPGANFWAVLLFFTLIVLGFSSAFVMLDVVATLLVDCGIKLSRPTIVTIITLISFLMCLPYCTEFGYYLLDGVDRWINNVALISVAWSEVVLSTTIYRWTDVRDQVGLPAFIVYNVGFFGGQVFGVSLAHGLSNPGAGAGAGLGFWAVCSIISTIMARTPDSPAPRPWAHPLLERFWYLAFYSGNQLRRDLNVVVGGGKNWNIPWFFPFLLRYVSGPVLAIVLSFAFPEFHTLRYDPMMITGFILSIATLTVMIVGLVMPRYYDVFVPKHRRAEGTEVTHANELRVEPAGLEEVEEHSDTVEEK